MESRGLRTVPIRCVRLWRDELEDGLMTKFNIRHVFVLDTMPSLEDIG